MATGFDKFAATLNDRQGFNIEDIESANNANASRARMRRSTLMRQGTEAAMLADEQRSAANAVAHQEPAKPQPAVAKKPYVLNCKLSDEARQALRDLEYHTEMQIKDIVGQALVEMKNKILG